MAYTVPASYEDIAPEYYDPTRHPTCANFREASAQLVAKWVQELQVESGSLCEVGAGKSLLAEYFSLTNQGKGKLILIDFSPTMLDYSRKWADSRTHLVCGDALSLPILSSSLDLLLSSLGDPYNKPDLWKEIARTLRPGGTAIFTTPSYEWAMDFRLRSGAKEMMLAEFELLNGERVLVPSWIYPPAKQFVIIEDCELFVQEYVKVPLSVLTSKQLSAKLLLNHGADSSIIEGYLVRKKS